MPLFYNISADNPNGIKVLDNPTKTLKALAFPIECLSEFSKRKEAKQAGVYILYHTAEKNEQPNIYIGQSSHNVFDRIYDHKRNKNFWNYALVFVEKGDFFNLNGTHAKIIESGLLQKAKECGVVVLDNNTGSNAPRVLDSDKYAANTWTEEIIIMTQLLGLPFFMKNDYQKPLNNTKRKMKKKPSYFKFKCPNTDGSEDIHSFRSWINLEEEVSKKCIELYGIDEFEKIVLNPNIKRFHTLKKHMFGRTQELMVYNRILYENNNKKLFINTDNGSDTIMSVINELLHFFPEANFELIYGDKENEYR